MAVTVGDHRTPTTLGVFHVRPKLETSTRPDLVWTTVTPVDTCREGVGNGPSTGDVYVTVQAVFYVALRRV